MLINFFLTCPSSNSMVIHWHLHQKEAGRGEIWCDQLCCSLFVSLVLWEITSITGRWFLWIHADIAPYWVRCQTWAFSKYPSHKPENCQTVMVLRRSDLLNFGHAFICSACRHNIAVQEGDTERWLLHMCGFTLVTGKPALSWKPWVWGLSQCTHSPFLQPGRCVQASALALLPLATPSPSLDSQGVYCCDLSSSFWLLLYLPVLSSKITSLWC